MHTFTLPRMIYSNQQMYKQLLLQTVVVYTSNGNNISMSTCQVKGLVVALDTRLGRKLEQLMACRGFSWRLLVC